MGLVSELVETKVVRKQMVEAMSSVVVSGLEWLQTDRLSAGPKSSSVVETGEQAFQTTQELHK